MPYGVENAERTSKGDTENPGQVPHCVSSIETGRIALNVAFGHRAAQRRVDDCGVAKNDRQKNQRRQQHHEQCELARRRVPNCHDLPIAPNLIVRDFTAPETGSGWPISPTSRPQRGGCIWRPSPLQPKDRRLGRARSYAGRTRIRGTDDGRQPATAAGWMEGSGPVPGDRAQKSDACGLGL